MTTELLFDATETSVRAALTVNGRLSLLHIDSIAETSEIVVGAIYLGRVERPSNALKGVFVTLAGRGESRLSGLLLDSDLRPIGAGRPASGQPVLVQVKSIPGEGKAPPLTMNVTLPGRRLAHTPLTPGVTFSRRATEKITPPPLPSDGWILRRHAADASENALCAEAEALSATWADLRRRTTHLSPPVRLSTGPDALERLFLDLGAHNPDRCFCADPERLARATALTEIYASDSPTPQLWTENGFPLFERHDLEGAIAELRQSRVALPEEGSLIIEPTAALISIDVNGGARANPLQANIDAAREIARQIQLRNLGGVIVIDFINMRRREDNEKLLETLKAEVADDPGATQVYGMSRLGLVEMTRRRRGAPLK
ncbi:Ribonuclease E [Azospirillaceae bacterium]